MEQCAKDILEDSSWDVLSSRVCGVFDTFSVHRRMSACCATCFSPRCSFPPFFCVAVVVTVAAIIVTCDIVIIIMTQCYLAQRVFIWVCQLVRKRDIDCLFPLLWGDERENVF
ncbi:hypothetical protein HPB50_014805 [Hyalomma asiaticum]|uniref:Uncharacterized protein n=1 Tax=Hyalomma asiaticum TaxID=266040 RepID=A0ACB7SJV7_HYAAI|nr:hypothetical protein HPB50_014805 [Hyalomma asiaticum]